MMVRIQIFRLFSIINGIAVGLWLPLRLISVSLPSVVILASDVAIAFSSGINIYIYLKQNGYKLKDYRSWLNLSVASDLFCALPLLFLHDAFFEGTPTFLIYLNLLPARHVWNIKKFLEEFDNLKPLVYRLVPLGLFMPLLVHLLACGWILLGSGTVGPDPDKTVEYVKALYWAMTTLTTVGYGDISAKTIPQMIYTCGVQLVGVGVFGFVLSNVASLLSRLDAAREHHMDNLDQIEGFMGSYQIPSETRAKVRSYYHYVWKAHQGRLDKSVLEVLPAKLQSELNFAINHTIIEKVSFFKDASREMLEDIMLALDHKVLVPGERIFRAGDAGDSLYMIHSGQVEILTKDNKLIATLSEGAVFGEIALISDGPRTATAKAASYCDLYALPKEDFNRIVEAYPDFKRHLEDVMKARQKSA